MRNYSILIYEGDDLKGVMWPPFVHEIGDSAHHMSMARTCERDEDGGLVRGTGPSEFHYQLHVFLDTWFFYPVRHWLTARDGASFYAPLKALLSFLWGLNCGFPFRDVALYLVWLLRGCPSKKIDIQGGK